MVENKVPGTNQGWSYQFWKKNQVEPNEAAQDFQRGMDLAEEAMLMEAMEEAPKSRDKTAGFFFGNHGRRVWSPGSPRKTGCEMMCFF